MCKYNEFIALPGWKLANVSRFFDAHGKKRTFAAHKTGLTDTMNKMRILLVGLLAAVAILAGTTCFLFFSTFSTHEGHSYLYIDDDDTYDSVCAKLDTTSHVRQLAGFRLLATAMRYPDHVRSGRYETGDGINTLQLIRNLRNGSQVPVKLTITGLRSMGRLAHLLGNTLMVDSARWAACFADSSFCAAYGTDTTRLPCLFIPNTYEVYWDITPDQLLHRMQRESEAYWTSGRMELAREAGLSPEQVITLASIVDQETANDAEKPLIAGMYLNRYRIGMKLQADPTVKYALRQPGLRRIYHNQLLVESPYNTYLHEGLPPGPICIPALSSIEAVLHFVHHDYLYMCAKEDFSGTHNFARTYEEHLRNARKYTNALNKRGIN